MKKFFLLLMILSSCSNKIELTQNDKKYLIKVVDSLHEVDQSTRRHFHKIDSTYNLPKRPPLLSSKETRKILGSEYDNYKKKIDSNRAVIRRNDSLNTKMLIQLTKEYGFPGNKRLGVYKSSAYFIFVHTPQKYYPEVRSLITKENQEGRISDYKKKYIFWHLDGRNGMPPRNKN